MRAYIDIDGVVALLDHTWLRMYNSDYNDNLQPHQIKSWAIQDYVKPECGIKIFDYLEDPYLYDHVIPVEGALNGVGYIRSQGFEVTFVTSCPWGDGKPKYKWLCDYGFVKPNRVPKDFVVMSNKILLDGFNAIMIDDNYDYIKDFKGYGILFTRSHNEKDEYRIRMNSWNDIYTMRIKI